MRHLLSTFGWAGILAAPLLLFAVDGAAQEVTQQESSGGSSTSNADEEPEIDIVRRVRRNEEEREEGAEDPADDRSAGSQEAKIEELRREIEERAREGITRADLQLARRLDGSLFCAACDVSEGEFGVDLRLLQVESPSGGSASVDRLRRRFSPASSSGPDSPGVCTEKLTYADWRIRDLRVVVEGRKDDSVMVEIDDQTIGLPFRGCLMVRLRERSWGELLEPGERAVARYRLLRYDRRHGVPPHWSRDVLEVSPQLADREELTDAAAEGVEGRLEGMVESRELYRCWEAHLPRVPATARELSFQVELGETGRAQKVRGVNEAPEELRPAARCAAGVVREMDWPAPGRADASFTFELAIRTYGKTPLLP